MRPSNNSKTEEKEGQIGLQIQKEAIFLVPKAIARQPQIVQKVFSILILVFLYELGAVTRFRIFSKISLDSDLSILNSTKKRPNAKHSKIAKYWIK